MEESAETPRQPFEVRTEKLVPSSAEIVWHSDSFPNLPMSETLLSWCLPEGEIEDLENVRKAVTLNEMGREVGWGFMIFANKAGERFAFLGIKGVGITGVGRELLKRVPKPVSHLEVIAAKKLETMETVYELEEKSKFLLPKEGEKLPVAGFVGLKEAEADRDNAIRLIKEGFWVAEPVMIFKQEDSEIVKEAKKRGIIPVDEQEAREVRAFRNPLRLRNLDQLNLRAGSDYGTKEDQSKIRNYLELSSRVIRSLGEDLEKFGQKDEIVNYTLWFFNRLGRQFGIMARSGFWHSNIIDLQNTTLAGEVVDLGTETKWTEPEDLWAMERYCYGLKMAAVIYASASLIGREIDLEAATREYHNAFMEECSREEGFKKKIVNFVSTDKMEREQWLEPIINSKGELVSTVHFGNRNDPLRCLGALPEERREVEWGKKKLRLPGSPDCGYIDLLRYYAGKCWQEEVSQLTGEEITQKRAA